MSGVDAEATAVFLEELRTLQLASAACHGACRVLGCCKVDDSICLVMPLYPTSAAKLLEEAKGQHSSARIVCIVSICSASCGCSATQPECAAGPLSIQTVIAIAIGMLEALAQLHTANVLHLNLKPSQHFAGRVQPHLCIRLWHIACLKGMAGLPS